MKIINEVKETIKYYSCVFWNALKENRLFSILSSRPIWVVVVYGFPIYCHVLDIWSRQPYVEEYSILHHKLFWIIMPLYVLILCINDLGRLSNRKINAMYDSSLTEMVASIGNIVNNKSGRIEDACLVDIHENLPDNIFKVLQAKNQITFILTEISRCTNQLFELPENDPADVTMMYYNQQEEKWEWFFQLPHKTDRMEADVLMKSPSAAKLAFDNRATIFYTEKNRLDPDEQYTRTFRDSNPPSGSIYCSPLIIETNKGNEQYIICISTYKKYLSRYYDKTLIKFIEYLFEQYINRLQLELRLLYLEKQLKKVA